MALSTHTTLGDSPRFRGAEGDSHADSQPGKHVDQRVGAEYVEPPAQEIAYAWLRDAHDLGCFGLREPASLRYRAVKA
jgi:hypothetical protein